MALPPLSLSPHSHPHIVGVDRRPRSFNSYDFNNTIVNATGPPPHALYERIYLDTGDTDGDTDIHPATIAVDAHMTRLGLDPFYYLDRGGSHDEASWGARFHVPMSTLFPPVVHVPTVM